MQICIEHYKQLAPEASTSLAESLAEMYDQWKDTNHTWTPQAILLAAKAPEGDLWLAKNDSDQLLGFALFRKALDEVELLYIHVDIGFQRLGVGATLMNTSLQELEDSSMNTIFLEVRPSNKNANLLYKKLGFTLAGRRPRYYHDGEDALIMVKKL
jgi:[ribosomal protein S18]-alanine N-acetyltransferase